MNKTVLIVGGIGAIAVFFLWKKNADAATLQQQNSAPSTVPTAGQGRPSVVDTLETSVGTLGGGAIGGYFGGPIGAAVGAKLGPAGTKLAVNQTTSLVKTNIAAVSQTIGGFSSVVHGDVVGGTKDIVKGAVKSATAPITSTVSAIRSLF